MYLIYHQRCPVHFPIFNFLLSSHVIFYPFRCVRIHRDILSIYRQHPRIDIQERRKIILLMISFILHTYDEAWKHWFTKNRRIVFSIYMYIVDILSFLTKQFDLQTTSQQQHEISIQYGIKLFYLLVVHSNSNRSQRPPWWSRSRNSLFLQSPLLWTKVFDDLIMMFDILLDGSCITIVFVEVRIRHVVPCFFHLFYQRRFEDLSCFVFSLRCMVP